MKTKSSTALHNSAATETGDHRTSDRTPTGSSSRRGGTSAFRQIAGDLDRLQAHAYRAAHASLAIDATCVHPMGIAAIKAEDNWIETPHFGPFHHSQRWRPIT